MAETAEFVTTIKVRDLISAYESKNDSVTVEFSRPRAKSVGNILAKNIIVRQNEFSSLDDVEKALRKLDGNLNFYEVYNKAKHVDFQEQLFNILTSIVNIESDAEDASVKKKRLISQTQTLVSFLNQKLPSNVNQVISPGPADQYKYTTYSSYVKENGTAQTKSTNGTGSQKYAIYSETTKPVDVTDSSADAFVSVKKLKENFQPKDEIKNEELLKSDKKFKTEYTIKMADSTDSKGSNQGEPKTEQKEQNEIEQKQHEEETLESVSVTKLRNLFETKSEESAKGLSIIADDKPSTDKPTIGDFTNTFSFPYTDRNLGNVRLQRSVSGNYMNYVGLLKRTDINRSKSVHDLNKTNHASVKATKKIGNNFEGDSGKTLEHEDENKNVEKVKSTYPAASSGNLEKISRNGTYTPEKEDIPVLRSVKEIIVKYSTITDTEGQKAEQRNIKRKENVADLKDVTYATAISVNINENSNKDHENVATVKGIQEENVNYLIAENESPQKENVTSLVAIEEENVPYSTVAYVDINQETGNQQDPKDAITGEIQEVNLHFSKAEATNVSKNENVASVKGTKEVEVTYSTATSVDPSQKTDKKEEQNIVTTEEVQEVNVKYSKAEASNILKNENIASVKGAEEVDVSYSTAATIDINQGAEREQTQNVATVEGLHEVNVNYSKVESGLVQKTENVASLTGADEVNVNYSSAVSNHLNQNSKENVATIEGTEETIVNYSTVESKTALDTENVAHTNGPDRKVVTEYIATFGTSEPEVTNQTDATDNVSTCATSGSDDYNRDAALTEEEIDKIDEIVVNAEDLKNADDEFEKLLERNEKEKVIT